MSLRKGSASTVKIDEFRRWKCCGGRATCARCDARGLRKGVMQKLRILAGFRPPGARTCSRSASEKAQRWHSLCVRLGHPSHQAGDRLMLTAQQKVLRRFWYALMPVADLD